MKKTLYFAAAVLALAACSKESPVKEESAIDASKIVFDIKVENADGDATKGVKTAWETGDVVYLFFEENTSQYVKMTCNGSSWTYTDKEDDTTFSDLTLEESGKKVSAVYFPNFVFSGTPTWSTDKWTFGTVGGYYQTAADSYTVTSTSDVTTLSATLNLSAPTGISQIYIPTDEYAAAGTGNEYVLTATHFKPFNFNGIVPGAEATSETTTNGFPMTGYEGSMGGASGLYFWGIFEGTGTYDFDFQLVTQNAEKKYAISSKSKSKASTTVSTSSIAIKLTGLTDNGNFVSLGYADGPLWATGNLSRHDTGNSISTTNHEIADPLAAGDYFQWGATGVYNTTTYSDQWTGTAYDENGQLPTSQDVAYQVSSAAWRIPTSAQFSALFNTGNTDKKWTDWTNLGTTKGGYLVTSKKNGIALFFPAAGYCLGGRPDYVGSRGYYWSSTPDPDNGSNAYCLAFDSSDVYPEVNNGRTNGLSVRPVKN